MNAPRKTSLLIGLLMAATGAVGLGSVTVAAADQPTRAAGGPPEVLAQLLAPITGSDEESEKPAKRAGIRITGAVEDRGRVSMADLREFDQHEVKATYLTGRGEQTHTFAGPLLLDVIAEAEPALRDFKNDMLRFALLVRATDGYEAVIALAELLPEGAGTQALIALTEDGEALEIPRIAMPSDAHGGRYVFDVAEIAVLRLTANAAQRRFGRN